MGKHTRLPEFAGAPNSAAPRSAKPHVRYYAFLSYSHKDQALADWLQRELEQFRVPSTLAGRLTANGVIPTRLAPIFRDQHELAAADDLGEEIEEALANSHFLIVLCSPDAARSRWTNAEIDVFKRSRPDGCVLAAIGAGEPFASDVPGREDEECFPPALRQRYDRRGRPTGKRAEPLAADLRGEGEVRRMGFLRLVAGMLGVGLDELVQRETTRRHRRLAWLTAGSIAGMAVTTTLAFTAIQARDAARDQRREAEGLVAFMLGDLKDKLEPIGRLDALDGVGTRVLAYYSKQDASELSDAALLQRSRALSLTADVAYLRGDLANAARLYGEALSGTAEAVRRSPDDPRRMYDHVQNVFWTGELARRRGELETAEKAFREYKRFADRMVALQPDDLRWRTEAQNAEANLGIVLYAQRRFTEAGPRLEGALRTIEALAAIDPRNLAYQEPRIQVLAWLADTRRAEGRLDEAITIRERQLALLATLAGDERSVTFKQWTIPAHQALGILYASRGRLDPALAELRQAVAIAGGLIAIEPRNDVWKRFAANARIELGKTLLVAGQREEATQQIGAGCALVAAAPAGSAAQWGSSRTQCLSARARISLASGRQGEALNLARQAVAAAQNEQSSDRIANLFSRAAAYRLLGDVLLANGDPGSARRAWSSGLGLVPSQVRERPSEMFEHAELLRRLGRTAEAQALDGRLSRMGYKSLV
ncbi:MAG TPA: toll/interleukin-1 receptor domain-containing protein [Sphingomicrobium sp.]|nr:toll/interleukin-1 receptor domain-containing protein [Sphingomicrobium sp.]